VQLWNFLAFGGFTGHQTSQSPEGTRPCKGIHQATNNCEWVGV
jgi:hypothetical protein